MAIDTIIEGAVQNVRGAIDRSKPDIEKLRRGFADRTQACLLSIEDGNMGDPWLADADTDTVAFSPVTADGQPILINGKTTTFWPRASLASAIENFRDAINLGEFDDQLVSGGQPTVSPKIEGEQLPDDTNNGSLSTGGGRTDADERDTRFTEHLGQRTTPNA